MNKKLILSFIVGFILLYVSIPILNSHGYLYFLNYFIKNEADISCKTDSDCTLVISVPSCQHSCPSCGTIDFNKSAVAINSNWKPFCFEDKRSFGCVLCIGQLINKDKVQAKCITNICTKVPI